jgi:hypothetical protein
MKDFSSKIIVPTGKMSNLVNMYAFIWDGEDKLRATVFIYGKADDDHYIVHGIEGIGGVANVCKIVHLKDMIQWTFYPTRELAEDAYTDYSNNGRNRYKIPGIDTQILKQRDVTPAPNAY